MFFNRMRIIPLFNYRYSREGKRACKAEPSALNSRHWQQVYYLPALELHAHSNDSFHIIDINSARILRGPGGNEAHHVRYSNNDRTGSITHELDENAQTLSSEVYYPFGGTALWATRNQTTAFDKTRRYAGKERDASGLVYYGFRYYVPWLIRWLNPDPAGNVDGLNRFCMVSNNPLTLTDDDGRMKIRAEDIESCQPSTSRDTSAADSTSVSVESAVTVSTADENQSTSHSQAEVNKWKVCGAAAVVWSLALAGQSYTQCALEAAGLSPDNATLLASLTTEVSASAMNALYFMPGIDNASPGWKTFFISWGLYVAGGGGGGYGLSQIAPETPLAVAGLRIGLTPLIAAGETYMFAQIEGAQLRSCNRTGTYWSRLKASLIPRTLPGMAMRTAANTLGSVIASRSASLGAVGAVVAALPSLLTAAIPNVRQVAEYVHSEAVNMMTYMNEVMEISPTRFTPYM